MALPELFGTQKALIAFPGWSAPALESGVSWFNAPLEVEGVVLAGFTLHGECCRDLPDQNVGLELQLQLPEHRHKFSLARLDWLSIKGGHSNLRRHGHPLSGHRCRPTHYHDFDLNYDATKGRMLMGDLPFARDLSEDIQSFEEMRQMAGNLLRINNIDIVGRPKWEYDLFRHE